MSSSPGLALGALRDADERASSCSPCSASTSRGDADLALAAVDDQQVGRRILAGDDPRAAARQRLAHRRVVVAARGGVTLKRRYSDVCIASRSKITHDATARSPIVCETSKHSIRCASAGKPERLLQRGEPVLLRRLLRELLADRERRHSASPSRATPGARRRDCRRSCTRCPACADSTSASASSSSASGGDDRRRHRALDVVLREKRRHDLGERRARRRAAERTCGRRRAGRRGPSPR